MTDVFIILFGKHGGKRHLGRCTRIWEDNIRMDLREIRWVGVDWTHLAENRAQCPAPMNTVTRLWVP
jgi:hypothetical protein